MRTAPPLAALGLALALILSFAAPAPARQVPRGWVGVMADGPLFAGGVNLGSELSLMDRSGVETVRVAIYWSHAQPSRPGSHRPTGWANVAGVPTDFAPIDQLMAALGAHHMNILPVVLQAPPWARIRPGQDWSPPTRRTYGRYAVFLKTLVRRYGPTGRFWATRPASQRAPIRDWQVWNEPNGRLFWTAPGTVRSYVGLLSAAHRAVKAGNRRARVVLAGLVGLSYRALDEIYRRGGRRLFDVAAIHPFTRKVHGPRSVLSLIHDFRAVMARHGDGRKPLDITEMSWTSGAGKLDRTFGYDETERGQAAKLTAALDALAAVRTRYRIERAVWYTWLTADENRDYPFDWAGLRTFTAGGKGLRSKPALAAFAKVAKHLRR